jgi:hypothetical protein
VLAQKLADNKLVLDALRISEKVRDYSKYYANHDHDREIGNKKSVAHECRTNDHWDKHLLFFTVDKIGQPDRAKHHSKE